MQYDYQHEIVVTVGGSEAIDIAMRAMLDPGDEVLIPMPSYVSYLPCAVLANGVPVPINLKAENDFRLTAEELEEAIRFVNKECKSYVVFFVGSFYVYGDVERTLYIK